MKAMVFSDLITMKSALLQLFIINFFIAAILIFTSKMISACIAAITSTMPFMYLISISAYDEMQGWERFRMTLPITRKQVVIGRYVSMFLVCIASVVLAIFMGIIITAIASVIPQAPQSIKLEENPLSDMIIAALFAMAFALFAASISLPPFLRFGATKGVRVIPVVVVFLVIGVIALLDNPSMNTAIENLLAGFGNGNPTNNLALIVAAIMICVTAIYVISAIISSKLYVNRKL